MWSWTILDELWEEIKEYIPKKQRDPNKHYQKAPVGQACLPDRCWEESSMFCELGVSGKLFRENMGAAAVSIDIFRNGQKQAFSRKSGS